MFLTTSGITCSLTVLGKQLLADNSANFNITRYRFSDDEINYADFDGSSIEAKNTNILNTPILEAATVAGTPSQRYQIFSAQGGNFNVAKLDSDIQLPFTDGTQNNRPFNQEITLFVNYDVFKNYSFTIRTFFGSDSRYYVDSLRAPNYTHTAQEIVLPSYPYYDGIACTDPFETLQLQTQARITLNFLPTHLTLVDGSRDILNASDVMEPNASVLPIVERAPFSKVGFVTAKITIVGNTTQQRYFINLILYSPVIIQSLFRNLKKIKLALGITLTIPPFPLEPPRRVTDIIDIE